MKHSILAAIGALSLALPLLAHAQELPPAVASSKTLRVAIVPNYPPLEYKDTATGKLTGFDVELGEALAAKLGLTVAWQETSFDQMMPAITTDRVDMVLSGMSDLATRHETASFVDYLKSGPQFFTQNARAAEFADMKALCGKKVGASRRTNFPQDIAAWSKENCPDDKQITFVGTEGSADARTQLRQARIDAAVQGGETLPYIMGQDPNTFVALGKPIAVQYTGIATAVKQDGLQKALSGALDALIADGSYAKLLAKWQLDGMGVERATINAGK